jgi:hypothetical protein
MGNEEISRDTEEVIFSAIDSGWDDRELPITLITFQHKDGTSSMDVHRQTGPDFDKHMAEAEKVLTARGLRIDYSRGGFVGPSGYYRSVVKIEGIKQ